MIPDVLVAAAALVLVALTATVLLVLVRDRSRTRAELADTRAEAAELRARVEALALQMAAARREPEEYVITHLGEGVFETDAERLPHPPDGVPERIDGKLFADLVLRETVVKAAALGHGVRRAMAPETRNRIRFEIRREVKRSRKERKNEFKRVRREMQDRQRAAAA